MSLTFVVIGVEAVRLPDMIAPARADELWRTTCFEMFWKPDGGDAYVEFNLSPSLGWAAYRFDRYRDRMRDLPLVIAPQIERVPGGVEVDIDLTSVPRGPATIGLSAVIEEIDGTKSYWALRHPAGPPDFHHPDCFAFELPAVASS
ncbi:DOMON-like domain-containing protein [Sphingomonas donggukensis]|uniref:DOMON-like domain-containing protein n=1 Tax=Sphingomonas donggukensis TaxID=2949093 RepID=A0ABY4TVC8_9SPHN|nr:DOMON-like domain-containing protein [Sphingomonas donggukensis]URW76355.1 DOMON-like domain-containing protein [Sphingomonas donggukensis]